MLATEVAPPIRRITLYAERVGDRYGHGLTPGRATVPGPTLVMNEGERREVRLVNRTRRQLGLHAHGVDYDAASDGTIRPGSVGYWDYHDHCLGSEHGTEGVAAGLYGALIVRRTGDRKPTRAPNVVVMLDATINGRPAADTPTSPPTWGSGWSSWSSGTATPTTPSTCTATDGPRQAPVPC